MRIPTTEIPGALRRRAGRWLAVAALLRFVPPVLLAAAVLLNLLLGLLPGTFVVAVGLLLRQVPRTAGGAAPAWTAALGMLAVATAAFAAQQLLAPLQSATGELVVRHVDRRCRGLLLRAALIDGPAAALDDQELLDRLDVAREALDRTAASPGDAAAGLLALLARYVQLLAAAGLVAYALSPWAALVIGTTALVIRFGQRGSLGAFGDFYDSLAGEKRKTVYLKRLGSGLAAAKEIRMLGLLRWLRERHRREDRQYLTAMWRGRRRLLGRPFLVLAAVGLLGAATVLALLAGAETGGGLDLLRLGIALQAVLVLVRFGVYFPECDVQTQYGLVAYQALLAFREGARRMPAPAPGGGGGAAGRPRRAIRFEQVTFRYRPEGDPVLDRLDLDLPAGTSTAVVGLNGAGKTTLVKLLTRLYDPTGGRITVDGTDLTALRPEDWQRRLSVLFQDYNRYELSVSDNIRLGAPAAPFDRAAAVAALRQAGAGDLLDSLPRGLETVLSRQYRDGRELSGGQWQRIGLARALYAVRQGASLLILDEPTAQLDVRAEVEFFDRFLDLTRGLTTVIISHRFSTVRRADRIVVLEHGRVAEQGTHDELLAADGRYAELFRLQAERFTEDPAREPLS